MSRIYRKDDMPDGLAEYKLDDLTLVTNGKVDDAQNDFKPSHTDIADGEFIPGGFDFVYEGGLTRDEIMRRSSDEADRIVEEAKAEAGNIRNDARSEGFEQGRSEGYEEGKRRVEPLMDSFSKALKELGGVRSQFYENAESEMIKLITDIVKVVIGIEIERDPSAAQNVIRKAVNTLRNREEMNIVVNPDDLAEAEKFRPELSKEVEDIDKVTFKSDPLITRGGCMLETNIGSIDARVETQLKAIQEAFILANEKRKAQEEAGGENLDQT